MEFTFKVIPKSEGQEVVESSMEEISASLRFTSSDSTDINSSLFMITCWQRTISNSNHLTEKGYFVFEVCDLQIL